MKDSKSTPLKWRFMLIAILTFSLSACHLPQAQTRTTEPDALALRLTQAAGVTTPTPYMPPIMPTSTATAPVLRTPTPNYFPINTPTARVTEENGYYLYTIQPGDTLAALTGRFGVAPESIKTDLIMNPTGYLPAGEAILIPNALEDPLPYHIPLLPDTEITYGPTVGTFDAAAFSRAAGGFLSQYEESVGLLRLSGPEIVQLVAEETATNPMLLLTFLEYRSGWVYGYPQDAQYDPYPIGYGIPTDSGLYKELMITARILAEGFYGWRDGSLVTLTFDSGENGRLFPGLNAGSAALLHLFSAFYPRDVLETRLFDDRSFFSLYQEMFGDYWQRSAEIAPYLTEDARQPRLYLPFQPGAAWSLTAGAHITWQTGTPRGALDFAPVTGETPCAVSFRWVTAAAPGLVVRAARGVVAVDLDGDGDEGTGWVLIYMHIAESGRVAEGTWLDLDDRIGHPSCEGGYASGTHLHFARKYNGEWAAAQGPLPLIISGWHAFPGEGKYEGYLQQGDEIITARPDGSYGSTIYRED